MSEICAAVQQHSGGVIVLGYVEFAVSKRG